jgi:hypothetical protein
MILTAAPANALSQAEIEQQCKSLGGTSSSWVDTTDGVETKVNRCCYKATKHNGPVEQAGKRVCSYYFNGVFHSTDIGEGRPAPTKPAGVPLPVDGAQGPGAPIAPVPVGPGPGRG